VAVKILITASGLEDAEDIERALTMSNPVMESLQKESGMMAALRHPNIVGFLGVCITPPCVVTGALHPGWWGAKRGAQQRLELCACAHFTREMRALTLVSASPPSYVPRQHNYEACADTNAEFCARGSLTDVLRGAKLSPAKAALLDWPRRLNMVSASHCCACVSVCACVRVCMCVRVSVGSASICGTWSYSFLLKKKLLLCQCTPCTWNPQAPALPLRAACSPSPRTLLTT
jgi:hypothetical protein